MTLHIFVLYKVLLHQKKKDQVRKLTEELIKSQTLKVDLEKLKIEKPNVKVTFENLTVETNTLKKEN